MTWETAPVLLLDGPADWAEGTVLTLPPGWLRHDPAKALRAASLPEGEKREATARQWAIAARKAAHASGSGALAAGPGVASLAEGSGVQVVRKGERVDLSPRRATEAVRPGMTPKDARGWAMLHRYALAYDGDVAAALRWLERFAAGLGCDDCRAHWPGLVAESPPDLSDAEAFFRWSTERHNDVNRRMGKPEVSVEDARAVWA